MSTSQILQHLAQTMPTYSRFWESMREFMNETQKLSAIAGPLILSSLVSMGVSVIDLAMMSWLSPRSLAAGAVVSDYYSVFFYFFTGILAALTALVSQARGAKDSATITKTTQAGFMLAIIFAAMGLGILWNTDISLRLIGIEETLIRTGMPYARMMGLTFGIMVIVNLLHYFLSAHGVTKAIFVASLFALPLNALGNYVLMFGSFGFPKLGLAGAGLSSFIAAFFMVGFLFTTIARKHYIRRYALLRIASISRQPFKEIFRVGVPIGISNLGEMGVFLLTTVLMGKFGAEMVAAHIVALRVAGIIYALPLGYAQAATIRIGYAIGAQQRDKISSIVKTSLAISASVGLLYLVFILLFRMEISTLFFTANDMPQNIVFQSSVFLLILAIAQPFDTIATVANGVLRGFKDTKQPMYFSMVSFWGIGFLGGIVMAFSLGLKGIGIWAGLAGSSVLFGLLVGMRLLWKYRQFRLQPTFSEW